MCKSNCERGYYYKKKDKDIWDLLGPDKYECVLCSSKFDDCGTCTPKGDKCTSCKIGFVFENDGTCSELICEDDEWKQPTILECLKCIDTLSYCL